MSYLFAGNSLEGCLEILAEKDWCARHVADFLVTELPECVPLDTVACHITEYYGADIPEDARTAIDWGTVEVYVEEWLEDFFAQRGEKRNY